MPQFNNEDPGVVKGEQAAAGVGAIALDPEGQAGSAAPVGAAAQVALEEGVLAVLVEGEADGLAGVPLDQFGPALVNRPPEPDLGSRVEYRSGLQRGGAENRAGGGKGAAGHEGLLLAEGEEGRPTWRGRRCFIDGCPVCPRAVRCFGRSDRRPQRGESNCPRRVGPEQVAQIALRPAGDETGARKTPAVAEGDTSFSAR
jgi:hypothetical protein